MPPFGHRWPHVPQFSGSRATLVHVLPQRSFRGIPASSDVCKVHDASHAATHERVMTLFGYDDTRQSFAIPGQVWQSATHDWVALHG